MSTCICFIVVLDILYTCVRGLQGRLAMPTESPSSNKVNTHSLTHSLTHLLTYLLMLLRFCLSLNPHPSLNCAYYNIKYALKSHEIYRICISIAALTSPGPLIFTCFRPRRVRTFFGGSDQVRLNPTCLGTETS